jgi:hypothetical protein
MRTHLRIPVALTFTALAGTLGVLPACSGSGTAPEPATTVAECFATADGSLIGYPVAADGGTCPDGDVPITV